jgi:hypothetical protein
VREIKSSSVSRADSASMRRRLLQRASDESGIALVMALGIMLVLTIALTSTIYLTSSSQRHANTSNAGQKAYALAEAGVNNAVSVLVANYPGTAVFPGDSSLLPARTTTYADGTVTWGGSLVQTTLGTQWPFEWQITSTATVDNPTGPGTSDVRRTATAVVPVVLPQTQDAGGDSVLNFIYALTNIEFLQQVDVATPVYATNDLTLRNGAKITAEAKTVAVGGNLWLNQNQNEIGKSNDRLAAVYIEGSCQYHQSGPIHSPCQWDTDHVYAAGPGVNQGGTTIPSTLITQIPTLTSTQMSFWHRYSSPGPYFPCVTSSGAVPVFDTDTALNNSAGGGSPQNLTPSGAYSCTTPSGQISWNPGSKTLTIGGTVYIDGSAYISAGSGTTYNGVGTIVLSGTFSMDNHTQMCANTACDPDTWDPNTEALIIVANGDGAGCCGQSQVDPGRSIEIKKASFQGGLIGNKDIDASVTGTEVIGPIISVNGAVFAGQGSDASFPPIHFAPAGTGGITQPPPPGELLAPRNYGGG